MNRESGGSSIHYYALLCGAATLLAAAAHWTSHGWYAAIPVGAVFSAASIILVRILLLHEKAAGKALEREIVLSRIIKTAFECSRIITRALSRQELLDDICRILVKTGGFATAAAWAPALDGRSLSAEACHGSEPFKTGATILMEETSPSARTGPAGAFRTGLACLAGDNIALPILSKGRPVAVLSIFCKNASLCPPEIVELLTAIAEDVSYGLESLSARKDLKSAISLGHSLENQLAQAQKLEAIGRLAGGVAHDFNNILTAILGYSQLAMNTLRAGDPLKDDLAEIERGAKRAADLTRQLLIFSRKQIVEPRLFDPAAVIGTLQKMLRRIIGEQYQLVFTAKTAGGAIKADPSQVEQIVMNFIVNARDAMPAGGEIELRVDEAALSEPRDSLDGPIPPGHYAVVTVKDRGTGIPPETLSHIFEPFFTTKPIGQGTGLGLATVYGIVKQNGAFLKVDTAVGQGTAMAVYWPLSEQAPESEEPGAQQCRGGSESVILVEDDPGVRRLGERILAEAGYKVTACDGAEQALDRLRPEHVLLLSDVVMPEMNGKELSERLRLSQPRLKVLFTSGHSDEIISKEGMLEPGARLLQKPFTENSLLKAVREALDS